MDSTPRKGVGGRGALGKLQPQQEVVGSCHRKRQRQKDVDDKIRNRPAIFAKPFHFDRGK